MAAVEEFDYLCRLCAIKMDVRMGLPIFEVDEQVRNMKKKITACLPLEISISDQLPKVICEDCAFKVDEIFDFREKVLQTENMLMQMLKNGSKFTNSMNSVNDGSTVRMMDKQMIEIKKEETPMYLERDATVTVENLTADDHLRQLDINYVTSMVPESEMERQIIYCNNPMKFEAVVPDAVTPENYYNDPLDQVTTNSINYNNTEGIIMEYTKDAKNLLLKNILNNPTIIDEIKSTCYTCKFCGKVFLKPNSIILHFLQHFFNCPTCDLCFTNIESLNIHRQTCSKEENNVEKHKDSSNDVPNDETKTKNSSDGVPNDTSKTKISYNGVSNDKSKKKRGNRSKRTPKICPHCGKEYPFNCMLKEHLRKHTGEKPFKCKVCKNAFCRKAQLTAHKSKYMIKCECAICGKGFECKSSLTDHLREHLDLERHPCSMCNQTFKTKQNLKFHENRHLNIKPYKCKICGKGFITKMLCIYHQKIHSDIDSKLYSCEVCNKVFVSSCNLKKHLKIHTIRDKPYLCEVCGRDFLSPSEFKIHSTMHTSEESFKCDLCNEVFDKRSALHLHRRSHTGEGPYRCDVCDETFTESSPLAIHKRFHTGERPYKCDICHKGFISKLILVCHKKKHKTNETTNTDEKTTKEVGFKPIKLVYNNVSTEDVFILP